MEDKKFLNASVKFYGLKHDFADESQNIPSVTLTSYGVVLDYHSEVFVYPWSAFSVLSIQGDRQK